MNTPRKQSAYLEMTEAAKVIIDRIHEFPSLLNQLCREIEIGLIFIAMKRSENNCTQAARLLGLKRTTLVEKRKRYGMEIRKLKKNENSLP